MRPNPRVTSDSLVGQILDQRYQIEAELGAGGMGAVYKARHLAMQQHVAIKVLHTERAADPNMGRRFAREARSSFQIDHPHCVRATDFGLLEDGTLYMAMEYLDGRTLAQDIAVDGPMQSRRVRHIAAQVADGLHYAHSLGVVHRDLKPDNIMLVQRGGDFDFAKVFDFGLSKLFDDGAMLTGLSLASLTQDGMVFGTPEYMSPEQALGGEVGPASDVYALGVCGYEMLTGDVPFTGATFTEILQQHVQGKVDPPSQRRPDLQIDPTLEELVMACLAKEGDRRPSLPALRQALELGPQTQKSSQETLTLSAVDPSATVAIDGSAPMRVMAPAPVAFKAQRPWLAPTLIGLGSLVLGAGVVTFVQTRSSSSSQVDSAEPNEATKVTEGALATASDAGPTLAAIDSTETEPAVVGVDAAVERTPEPSPAKRDRRERVRKPTPSPHLAAAEAAFRSGNLLKQLSEANAALRDTPGDRRAAFLVGDALIKSGDKVRGCGFLRKAGRKHARAASCD